MPYDFSYGFFESDKKLMASINRGFGSILDAKERNNTV